MASNGRGRRIVMVVALLAGAAACGSDGGTADDTGGGGATSPTTPTTEAPEPEWVMHEGGDDCVCADGSDFVYFSRQDDPERVLLYFQGGGACFSEELCRFDSGAYDVSAGPDDDPAGDPGIFDLDHPDNPFRGWSMVFVPYCTGDVHLGDATAEYGPDLTVEHNGQPNARAGLDHLVESFPDAQEVFVAGSSAGGVPAPLYGGLVSDRLPDARVTVLADASGGYPSNPGVNLAIGQLWGVAASVPDWPVTRDVPQEEFGIPDIFTFAGTHDPDITMARYDNAWDGVQRTFVDLAGIGEGGLPALLDQNEQRVEGGGVDLSVYVAPGEEHTILGRAELYDLTVEGRSFLDWLTTLVAGQAPGDVRCVDCGAPPMDG